MAEVVPALGKALETELPGIVERSGVVSREEWVHANVSTFARLLGSVEGDLVTQVVPPGAGLIKSTMAIANRMVSTRQFGYLLGFIGQRVLGQYDLALISAEAEPGRLLFVDENIRRTATALGGAAQSRSEPGSPFTRPPMPSSSRPIRGFGRIWRAGSRRRSSRSRPASPAWAGAMCPPGSGGQSEARAPGRTGWKSS